MWDLQTATRGVHANRHEKSATSVIAHVSHRPKGGINMVIVEAVRFELTKTPESRFIHHKAHLSQLTPFLWYASNKLCEEDSNL